MTSKKAVELLKEIVKFSQKSSGFEQVLKHVCFHTLFFGSKIKVQCVFSFNSIDSSDWR